MSAHDAAASTEAVVAVDIGGTKTAAAVVDREGAILATAAAATPGADGPDAILATAVDVAVRVVAEANAAARAGGHDGAAIRAVGIGTAGVVDVAAGAIVSSTDTLAGWAGTPVRALVAARLAESIGLDVPVHVQNDVDAHTVGELRFGAARGADSALVVAVGTGIGAGIVIDGRVHRGGHHVAGEIGHIPTPGAEHLRCPCGRMGHLEAIGSGVGMHRHYLSLGGDPAVRDGREVAARAAARDGLARRAVRESAQAIGRGIAAVMTVLDPERVVITGSVAQAGSPWWDALVASVHEQVVDALQDTPVVRGELGGDAPLRGAAASAWQLTEEKR
ncbi:ROK family protein [Microbacterium sp. KR10-403]|uniref:ROK family protein n=1 Tax=Microbacterium sp. KR10-403 TaxID=3158581 RepID=UPI0032E3E5E6